jgi:hypothetical protein
MKFQQQPPNKKPVMPEGRHSVRIRTIINVGLQRGYEGSLPTTKLVIEFVRADGLAVEKAVNLSSHEASAMASIVHAAGLDIADPDLEVEALLGKAVAIEVVGATFPKVDSVSALEDFDDDVPELSAPPLFIEDESHVTKDTFPRLPPLARKLWGERIRSRNQGAAE